MPDPEDEDDDVMMDHSDGAASASYGSAAMPAISIPGVPPPGAHIDVMPPAGGAAAPRGGGQRRKSGAGGAPKERPILKKDREPHLCTHDSNCNEPRTTKDRGGGLHVFCAKHKEEKQKAWREAAKRYRERRRMEVQGGFQAEGGAAGGAGGDLKRKSVGGGGGGGAGNGAPARAGGAAKAGGGARGGGKGGGAGKARGGPKGKQAMPLPMDQIMPMGLLLPDDDASSAASAPLGVISLPPHVERAKVVVKPSPPGSAAAALAAAGGGSTPLSAWPQFWFQKEMMRYVEMSTRELIKRDFDNFSQGRPAFEGYAIQHTFSYELNAAPERYRKPTAAGTLGVKLFPLEQFEWFGPLLDFLARQWWETGVIMMGEQIRKDEGIKEKLKCEQLLAEATTVEKRKRVLLSLLGSAHLRSYHHQEEQPPYLGPRHGHLLMILNIHGNGELVFTRVGAEQEAAALAAGRPVEDAEEVLRMPLRSGDVFCYTGDYRYELGAHVPLESEYRCFIALRLWLPGRECMARVRGPDGKFRGWRRLDKELDKERDDLWCTLDGRPKGTCAPNYTALMRVLQEPDEPLLLPPARPAAPAPTAAAPAPTAAASAAAATVPPAPAAEPAPKVEVPPAPAEESEETKEHTQPVPSQEAGGPTAEGDGVDVKEEGAAQLGDAGQGQQEDEEGEGEQPLQEQEPVTTMVTEV